jgi:hypothetical protein
VRPDSKWKVSNVFINITFCVVFYSITNTLGSHCPCVVFEIIEYNFQSAYPRENKYCLISYLVVETLKGNVWNTEAGSDGQCDANRSDIFLPKCPTHSREMSNKFESQHSPCPTIWSDIVVGRESGYLKIFFTFLEVNMSSIL